MTEDCILTIPRPYGHPFCLRGLFFNWGDRFLPPVILKTQKSNNGGRQNAAPTYFISYDTPVMSIPLLSGF